MMDPHVIILGAGVSGLSLGWRLAASGIPVDLLEASSSVGGLAGTVRENGYCLDFGPHSFFTEDPEILETVLDLFDHPLKSKTRQVKFYFKEKYLDYPLTAHSVIFQMGPLSGIQALFSFLKGKLKPRRTSKGPESVEDWAVENFGEHLYRTFFKPYTEQFWKIPCSELSSRSIPTHTRLSFTNTLRYLVNHRGGRNNLSLIERERLTTYYPETGYGEIPERLAAKVREGGGKIHLLSRVHQVSRLPDGRMEVHYTQGGDEKEIEGSYVVSTIPLNLLIKMLSPTPPPEVSASAEKLDYRPLLVLGMVTERQNILSASYVYMLDRPYNRITELNKFSEATSPPGDNVIAVEIPCLRGDAVWNASKEELFELCIESLTKDGFLSCGEVKNLLLVKSSYVYPIYRKGYEEHLKRVLAYIDMSPRLAVLGRTSEFMYMDADKCMRRAFDLADRLKEKLYCEGVKKREVKVLC